MVLAVAAAATTAMFTVPAEIEVMVARLVGMVVALFMAQATAPEPAAPAPKLPPVSIAASPVAMAPVPVMAPWVQATLRTPLPRPRGRFPMTPMGYWIPIGTGTGP